MSYFPIIFFFPICEMRQWREERTYFCLAIIRIEPGRGETPCQTLAGEGAIGLKAHWLHLRKINSAKLRGIIIKGSFTFSGFKQWYLQDPCVPIQQFQLFSSTTVSCVDHSYMQLCLFELESNGFLFMDAIFQWIVDTYKLYPTHIM